MTRRAFLSAAAVATPLASQITVPELTKFQLACMTLPYSAFPLKRALSGIAAAGYRYVGLGTTHNEQERERVPVLSSDATARDAKELASRCRGLGLEPVIMFAGSYVEAPEAIEVHTRRIEQAESAGIPFVITFGKITAGGRDTWIRNLKKLGPTARGAGVTILLKQHGGNTGTGQACSKIISEVADEGVKLCYDAGNVLDYEKLDPIPDIQTCWRDIRAFAIKDHRISPKNQDCGPGFGEIDHYKLLAPVLHTGRTMPLVCENIFAPLVPRPTAAEGIDILARRAREYMEIVVRGLQGA